MVGSLIKGVGHLKGELVICSRVKLKGLVCGSIWVCVMLLDLVYVGCAKDNIIDISW
jgi:hypothetical protein